MWKWYEIKILEPINEVLLDHSYAYLSMGHLMITDGWTRLGDFTFTFHFHALEREMATHSSVLAWRIPGTGEPGGLPSLGSHRVGHDWSDLAAAPDDAYVQSWVAVTKELCGWKGQKVFYLVLLEKLSQLLSQSHSLTGPSKAEPFALFPLPRMPSIVFFFSSLFKVLFLFTLFFKVFVFVFFFGHSGKHAGS